MSSPGLLEAKINRKRRTTGNFGIGCYFCGGGGGLVVVHLWLVLVVFVVIGKGVSTAEVFQKNYAVLNP